LAPLIATGLEDSTIIEETQILISRRTLTVIDAQFGSTATKLASFIKRATAGVALLWFLPRKKA
jgi:hypothetical protein